VAQSLVDWVGALLRVSADPASALDPYTVAPAGVAVPPLRQRPPLPPTADIWLWPEAPEPFREPPAGQALTPRYVDVRRALMAGLGLPGDGWLVLPASLGAICAWEAPMRLLRVTGGERLELQAGGRGFGQVRRIGVAFGCGHEAWARATWRERGLPPPEIVSARPAELQSLQRQGEVDALLIDGDGPQVPAWALFAPVAWSLPPDWPAALAPGWRPPLDHPRLCWLYAQLQAPVELAG